MPTCGSCHVSAVAVADTASAVRDLGFAGAFSVAAASALAIGYKRRLSHAPVAYSAAGDADADQTNKPTDSGLTNRAQGHL
jgi:hypothetical protein